MPCKPKKPCAYPGCPKLTDKKYCEEHQSKVNTDYNLRMRDKSANEFYHSSDWIHKRANFLIEHPFCEECRRYGRLTRANVVDHIVPISKGGAYLDDNNLQSLCSSCHSRKSIQEGSRFPNQYKKINK